MSYEIRATSVCDPIASESLATSLLHTIDVEGCGWLTSITAFKPRLEWILQPREIL
jgi:hypothetical protein